MVMWPDPVKNEIHVHPNLPEKWEHASLEHVRVLDGEISVYVENGSVRVENHTSATVCVKQ